MLLNSLEKVGSIYCGKLIIYIPEFDRIYPYCSGVFAKESKLAIHWNSFNTNNKNMNNKVYGVFSSSADPTQISLTVSSFVTGVGAILGTLAALNIIPVVISTADLQQVSTVLTASIGAGFTIYQGGQFFYGLFRKILNNSC